MRLMLALYIVLLVVSMWVCLGWFLIGDIRRSQHDRQRSDSSRG
jgi:hypothetical protein